MVYGNANSHGLKVNIVSNGCLRRHLDTSLLRDYFSINGCTLVSNADDADYNVFVTCAFVEAKIQECIEVIERLKQYPGELIVLDCLPGVDPMLLAEVFDGKSLKTPELERIDEFFPDFKHKLRDLPDANKVPLECFILPSQYKNLKEPSALDRIAVLRIAHGCTSKCAYCGIRRATGRLRSKAPDVCIGELKRLLDSGHNIFIIEGEDTGPYGVDIGTTLAHLLTQFVEVAEDYKAIFILQTCSPQWAIRYKETLFDLIDSDYLKRVCIDVQTGSPRMAKLMRRYPNIEEVIKLNRRLRQTIQDFIWTSQFIVGLPSESEEDFQQTLDFIDQTQIDELTFFGYSEIKGTACAAIPDKVPQAVIEARLARAENLMKEKGFDTKGFPLASQREARHKDFLERVERLCLQV